MSSASGERRWLLAEHGSRTVAIDELEGLELVVRCDGVVDVWCCYCGTFVTDELCPPTDVRKLLVDVLDHRCSGEER